MGFAKATFKIVGFLFVVFVVFGFIVMVADNKEAQLDADLKFYSDGFKITNNGPENWRDVEIKVNGMYKTYVAKIDSGRGDFTNFKELATKQGFRFDSSMKITTVTVVVNEPSFKVKSWPVVES